MGSIHTHISNFINTWEGWMNVFNGLYKIDFEAIYKGLKQAFVGFGDETSSLLS
ncbi:hypothetical protein FRC0024_02082 [Corynebacterium diphtheriae]|nr:hypothetical protein FRC0024_02082 [Corynebacterium diphtheriae]